MESKQCPAHPGDFFRNRSLFRRSLRCLQGGMLFHPDLQHICLSDLRDLCLQFMARSSRGGQLIFLCASLFSIRPSYVQKAASNTTVTTSKVAISLPN